MHPHTMTLHLICCEHVHKSKGKNDVMASALFLSVRVSYFALQCVSRCTRECLGGPVTIQT